MLKRQIKNRLLELMQERDREESRRIKLSDIAKSIGVSSHTIASWVRNDVTRFDKHMIEGLCNYFDCDVGDLLYFEWVETDEKPEDINL